VLVGVPSSRDVLWRLSTVSRVGEQAIFFLGGPAAGAQADVYEALDIRPLDSLHDVRAAVGHI
jgi:hypothetical protein